MDPVYHNGVWDDELLTQLVNMQNYEAGETPFPPALEDEEPDPGVHTNGTGTTGTGGGTIDPPPTTSTTTGSTTSTTATTTGSTTSTTGTTTG